MSDLKADRLYTEKEILPFLPFKKTTLRHWSKIGKFPKPVKLSEKEQNRWRSNDVIDWLREPVKWMEKHSEAQDD